VVDLFFIVLFIEIFSFYRGVYFFADEGLN